MKVLALFALLAVANAGKIDPALQARLKKGEVLDVIVELPSVSEIFDSPQLLSKASRQDRISTMVSMLKERTAASRAPFVNILSQLGLAKQRSVTKPIWISNRFEIQDVDWALAEVLARVPGSFVIREPKTASIIDPLPGREVDIAEVKQNENQWGVEMIQAPKAWAVSKGAGVVVGIIDTGVHMMHEALTEAYAGAWYDPYYNRPQPDDTQSHGTHCIGSVLGRANGIGVAPEAEWIACRGLNDFGSGTENDLLDCAQWMLTADPLPDVVTNSWGGGSGDNWYNDAMRAWIVAGIVPVFALGNSGPGCGSANSPGDQNYCIGVGATTSSDTMASFSSRGPTPFMLKPEVSAPGQDIISAGNTGTSSYTSKSGTSMATPHVAGAVALLLSSNSTLSYNQVMDILKMTGDHPAVSGADLNCGNGEEWPNNAFGHGRINIARAVGAPNATIYF